MASFNRTSHLAIAINISVLDRDKSPLAEIMEIISPVRGPFVCVLFHLRALPLALAYNELTTSMSVYNDNVSIIT